MFEKCPKCGKTHILKPKVCGCGYDFEKGSEEEKLICPKCKREISWAEIEKLVACPGCGEELNRLFTYPCPKCKESIGIKDKYCKCGEKLIREIMVCPFCKKEIGAESVVCPKCGKNLYLEEGEHVPEEYYCPRCGSKLLHATAECHVCDQPQYSYEE